MLTLMMAQIIGFAPGEFVHTLGDAQLYLNHLDQADEQLTREPLTPPQMKINPDVKDIFAFRCEDVELAGYQAHPISRGLLRYDKRSARPPWSTQV